MVTISDDLRSATGATAATAAMIAEDDDGFDQLRAALTAGEAWAWAKVHREYGDSLANYLAAAGMEDPERGVGDVLVHLARQVGHLEGGSADFRAGVFAIARRYLNDDPTVALRGASGPAGATATPAQVSSILAQLEDDEQEVLLLRVAAGLGIDEVATILGVRPTWVTETQQRAVTRLQAVVF